MLRRRRVAHSPTSRSLPLKPLASRFRFSGINRARPRSNPRSEGFSLAPGGKPHGELNLRDARSGVQRWRLSVLNSLIVKKRGAASISTEPDAVPGAIRHLLRGLAGLGVAAAIFAAMTAAQADGQTIGGVDKAVTVTIDNFTFSPKVVTIAPGTTVTWVNDDDIPHTVTNANRVFRSKALDTEDKYSFTFTTAGEYEYFCSLHPHMTGKVIVAPGAG
jgi:plastocyanin